MSIEKPGDAVKEIKLRDFGQLVDILSRGINTKYEVIEVPGRKPLHNFYNPEGIELRPILDPEHMPGITKLETVIVSEEPADLRGEFSDHVEHRGVRQVGENVGDMITMSNIAADPTNYEIDNEEARVTRGVYLESAANLLGGVYEVFPPQPNDVLVGVRRCGSNILDKLEERGMEIPHREDVDAKRLRFNGLPHALGAGTNIDKEVADRLWGKNVRLGEGVVAAATTEDCIAVGLKNMGTSIAGISCDAVVETPVGAAYAEDVKKALGVNVPDRAAVVGGVLNPNWYVEYGMDDPLVEEIAEVIGAELARTYVGKQVVGDGGDLTSNVN